MDWIIIIAVVVVIWVVIANVQANSPEQQLRRLKVWFDDIADSYYAKLQKRLSDKFSEHYDKKKHFGSESDYVERKNEDRVDHRETEQWRSHLLTVLTSDQYSLEAKRSACNTWFNYLAAYNRLLEGIEIGYMETDELVESGDYVRDCRLSMAAVMAAFGFDLRKEHDVIVAQIANDYPATKRTVRKVIS